MTDRELEFLPLEGFAISEGAIDLQRLAEDAPQIVAARVLKNVHHILVTPDLRPIVPDEVREPVDVVIMHVAGHGDFDRFEPVASSEFRKRVLHKPDAVVHGDGQQEGIEKAAAGGAVVNDHRLAAVTDQRIGSRAGLMGTDQMRSDRKGLVVDGQALAGGVGLAPSPQFPDQIRNPAIGVREGFTVGGTH
jgi:hypothetical protein